MTLPTARDRVTIVVTEPEAERMARRLEAALSGQARASHIAIVPAEHWKDAERMLDDIDVLVTRGAWPECALTPAIVARMPKLAFVQSTLSGYDRFQRALADRHDVLLATCRGIHGAQVSEMAILHMLAVSRNVRRLVQNQADRKWDRTVEQRLLQGRVVGIVGLGAIGTHLAQLCKAFGMTVYGLVATSRPVPAVDRVFLRQQLIEFAQGVDFLVLTVPHSVDTDGMISREVIAAMKPEAALINMARGAIVDEIALADALERGRIAGAGLDVFVDEGVEAAASNPLWALDNVFATPHLAGEHDRYADQILEVVTHNMLAYLGGDLARMINVVNL